MQVSLSEILNQSGACRSYECEIELENFAYMGEVYEFISKAPVSLTLSYISSKSVKLEAVIDVRFAAVCSRCLEPVELPVHAEVERILDLKDDGTACSRDDDEVFSYINGYDLDVDGLVDEEIMIGFPMKVLCSDDCKGICKCCGANLNKGECGCDRTELDPRMSIIRDLFKDSNV